MNICFQILSLNASGGAEKVLAGLASELARRGNEVSVICLAREGKKSFYPLYNTVKVYYLDRWDEEPGLAKVSKKIRNLWRIGLLYKMLRKIKPDISVSFFTDMTIYAAWAAKYARIPHISCERNSPWDKPEKVDKRIRRNRAFAVSKGCIVQTEAIKGYFDEKIQKKTIVIPNYVMLTSTPLNPNTQRDKRIVSIGRITAQKNQVLLVKAFYSFHKNYPEYILEIFGKAFGELNELEALIKNLNLEECVFVNPPSPNVHERIKSAKMFVLTSNFEGYPNALAEAVALGIPSISTDCRSKGPEEILHNCKWGLLVPLNDCDSLISAMELLINDEELAKHFSTRGIAYGVENNISSYVDTWECTLRRFARN